MNSKHFSKVQAFGNKNTWKVGGWAPETAKGTGVGVWSGWSRDTVYSSSVFCSQNSTACVLAETHEQNFSLW